MISRVMGIPIIEYWFFLTITGYADITEKQETGSSIIW